ncbi:MAG: peptide-methionine (R)-S-oxide reductase MsrB [Bacteroidia bacterium]
MSKWINIWTVLLLAVVIIGCASKVVKDQEGFTSPVKNKVVKTEEQWKGELTSEEFRVLREKGTERAFTGEYWDNKKKGEYYCAGCGHHLFSSKHKFKSGTGWPSFYDVATDSSIIVGKDNSYGMTRDELLCAKCGGHQGHVFDDGPRPTGLRYCINSVSMDFVED